jgi:hypothetical protein
VRPLTYPEAVGRWRAASVEFEYSLSLIIEFVISILFLSLLMTRVGQRNLFQRQLGFF